MHLKALLMATFIIFVGGCASTTEFTEDGPVEYIDLKLLHTWQTDSQKRSCEHLYKYDDLLVFNTGGLWGFYNPKSGLFATGLARRHYTYNSSEKPSLHYFIKQEGLCAKELKLPVNRKLEHQDVYIQDPFKPNDLKIQQAMDAVYSYKGQNLSQDLKSELKLIGNKFYDTSAYQSGSGIGEIVGRARGYETFESVAATLKNKKWTKGATVNKKNLEMEQYRKFRAHQKEYVKHLNSIGTNTWNNRATGNQNLSRGDKVCTFDNYYGFVEDIANEKMKIMWKGKVDKDVKGFFFGNISEYDADYKIKERINFKTLKVEDVTWEPKIIVAKCPFEFS